MALMLWLDLVIIGDDDDDDYLEVIGLDVHM
jgi:hypothetical protein